jgi:hypothetical protein
MANEIGVQRAQAVKSALERAERLQAAIDNSDNPKAVAAAVREAVARPEKSRNEAALARYQKRIDKGQPLNEAQEELVLSAAQGALDVPYDREPARQAAREMEDGAEVDKAVLDLLGQDSPAYPTTTDWAADEEGWMTPETGWKRAIYRLKNITRETLNCPHKHKTDEAALACALKAAKARNANNAPSMDGWKADPRYPWTEGRVSALIDELRAE